MDILDNEIAMLNNVVLDIRSHKYFPYIRSLGNERKSSDYYAFLEMKQKLMDTTRYLSFARDSMLYFTENIIFLNDDVYVIEAQDSSGMRFPEAYGTLEEWFDVLDDGNYTHAFLKADKYHDTVYGDFFGIAYVHSYAYATQSENPLFVAIFPVQSLIELWRLQDLQEIARITIYNGNDEILFVDDNNKEGNSTDIIVNSKKSQLSVKVSIPNSYFISQLSELFVLIILYLVGFVLIAGKENAQRRPLQNFDGIGAVLVLIFFSLMLCIPSFGQNFGWTSKAFLGVLLAAVVSLLGLTAAERKAVHPILPGSFMKRSAFILSVLALFLTQGLMQANMTNTIVFVNYTQPDNTAVSGYAISVMYVGMSLGAIVLGPLADKMEPKRILSGSFLLTGIGCGILLLFTEATSVLALMASLGILGFGLGGNGTIFMKVVLSGLSPQAAGAGTGTYGLFRDLAAPFGVAVFVPLFTNQITSRIAAGTPDPTAAVASIHFLAIAEILCVALGIVAVLFLPKRKVIKES